jgi:hypothetical protein
MVEHWVRDRERGGRGNPKSSQSLAVCCAHYFPFDILGPLRLYILDILILYPDFVP